MPAETHQHQDPVEPGAVLELLANVLDLQGDAASSELATIGVDDDLGIYSLWEAVTAELAERTVGELDLEDARVRTLGELADVFAGALHQVPTD
jgi:hypothetical protein